MNITSIIKELVDQLVKETSRTTEETEHNSRCEGSNDSNNPVDNSGNCSSDEVKRTSFRQMRKGMGFLLSQLRQQDTQPGTFKAATKRPASEQVLKDEFQFGCGVNMDSSRKVKKSCLDFNLTIGHEVYREEKSFCAAAPKFGFSLESCCNNYVKCCKWNFDGTLLATSSQDRKLRLFRLEADNSFKVNLNQTVPLGNLIYDICWNPLLNLLATSSKDQPIHCWTSKGTRALSFRGINEQDELDSAQSLCFASDGMRLYAGYKKIIRIFDMNRPGHQQREIKTWTKEAGGQKSIISCISMNPFMQGVYAAASYGKSTLYSELSPAAECVFDACASGVTHLRYSNDGNILFAAGRKENFISCWDLRFPGKVLANLKRPCRTNQRIYFDLDSRNRYLFSGSSSGSLFIFDLSFTGSTLLNTNCEVIPAHKSTLSGISIHPEHPLVATCSGQRVYPMPDLGSADENDNSCEYESSRRAKELDNSLALWSFI